MQVPPKHVVFDLDGTLIDSAPDLAAAINRMLADEGRRTLSLPEVTGMVGDGAPRLVERAMAATGAVPDAAGVTRLRDRFLAYYQAAPAVETVPYPGVAETLAALGAAGWRFAVCTNKPTGPAELVLRALGLACWFDAVVGPDRALARKPDPAHVRAVLSALGWDDADTIMVGDSAHDVAAGRGAGLGAIAVSYGYARGNVHAFGADLVIDEFAALPEALAALLAAARHRRGSVSL